MHRLTQTDIEKKDNDIQLKAMNDADAAADDNNCVVIDDVDE